MIHRWLRNISESKDACQHMVCKQVFFVRLSLKNCSFVVLTQMTLKKIKGSGSLISALKSRGVSAPPLIELERGEEMGQFLAVGLVTKIGIEKKESRKPNLILNNYRRR